VKALPLQHSLKLPARFQGNRMVEATRLCVKGNPHSSLVRSTLFKALHSYCLEQNVDQMMATGRRPVDRIYDSLLFSDVGESEVFYPMTFTGGVPHRVMHLAPRAAQSLWHLSQHSLYQFVFETYHSDINLSAAQSLLHAWECPEIDAPHMTDEDEHPPLRDMRTPWQPTLAFAH
jgi:hypothetical protein